MTKLVLGFFYCLFTAVSFHNFYVSTTSVRFVPDEKSLQITTQVFLDDFEAVLRQNGNDKTRLTPEVDQGEIDSLVEEYFRKNITFMAHGKIMDFDFLGKVYKSDVLVAYMELQLDSIAPPLSIENTIFFDYLPDQKNIIHLKLDSKRKSFLAVSSKSVFEIPKDFLNLNN
ncbi:MAG: hypothetical protein CBC02_009995 [Flavobacteriaceae bacterium TMED42]|nr:MAG: hypothetical protein CBC02_009995 [Flavobacteriaceae bacterium TMED42]